MDKNQESKFNFSDEEELKDQDQAIEQSKEKVAKDAKGLFDSLITFLNDVFGFRQDTDRDATIEAIVKDIPFKGATAWILICSIFVASVGLNANSTAVVIGAMLISPLMGPILGIGMSIAINDIDTLRKSFINFGVMVVLSILTAFFFFWLFPLSEETSELLGRTRPDIRDVLIAFFGGLALIIARTKKGTIASVIFGVAIATALMPPLCTAGYGLAIALKEEAGKGLEFALGAMYLFTINTIFIALATFITLKFLRFPMIKYANSAKRRRTARLATLLAVAVMIPAIWTFLNVLRESGYKADYKTFMEKNIHNNDDLWLRKDEMDMKQKTIKLTFNGEIDDAFKTGLEKQLADRSFYPNLYDFTLTIDGDKKRSYETLLQQLDRSYERIEEKDSLIAAMRRDLDSLKTEFSIQNNIVNSERFMALAKDAKIEFGDLESFGFAKMLSSNDFRRTDTIAVVNVKWRQTLTDSVINIKEAELRNWLKKEMNLDALLIKHD